MSLHNKPRYTFTRYYFTNTNILIKIAIYFVVPIFIMLTINRETQNYVFYAITNVS